MLGLARASQLAGWWNQGGNRNGIITDTTSTAAVNTNSFLLRPSYFADFSVASAAQQLQMPVVLDDLAVDEIDMTGTGTTAKKQIAAMTFRVGSDWMTTAPTEFLSAFNYFFGFSNNGTDSFRNISIGQDPGDNYAFGNGSGANIYVNKTVFNNNYRNRWLTCVFATSDTSADFADWAGGSDTYGNSWAGRARLFDTETMTPIATVNTDGGDGWSFNSHGSVPDLTQAWTSGFETSDYYLNTFGSFGDFDSTLYHRSDIQIMSVWYAVGSMVDIGLPEYYNQLAGSAVSKTVGGIRPWTAWSMHSAGTELLNGAVVFGYKNPQYTWARFPACTVSIQTAFDQVSPVPPEYISL
jgi:hypothetical protein